MGAVAGSEKSSIFALLKISEGDQRKLITLASELHNRHITFPKRLPAAAGLIPGRGGAGLPVRLMCLLCLSLATANKILMARDYNHDYRSRCIYHITICKASGVTPFSIISGRPERPQVELTPFGDIIVQHLWNFPNLCPDLRVLQYVIMPDHIHFVIFAQRQLPKVLGRYIGMMKVKCGQQAKEVLSIPTPLFEEGFYDRILRRNQNLDLICNYIRQNPYRLLIRQFNPDFFRRVNNVTIDGSHWKGYGNLHLLHNPFKAPVVIHRADSQTMRAAKHRRWKHLSENGGVLISPFISPAEKEIRRQCEVVNGKVILLSNKPFGEREKPAAHDFQRCAEGRLLILAPAEAIPADRSGFLYLNSIAESLCAAHR